jgi:hypothetical protein
MAGLMARVLMTKSAGLYPPMGGATGTRKRKRPAAKVATIKRRKKSRAKKSARLVKGSAAAKAYMAKIRRKRR